MGTHISRVKSVDLDSWTDEQLQSVVNWGNARANKYWEAKLAEGHAPSEAKIENFIRTKYDLKRWAMDGPIPDPATLGDDAAAPVAAAPTRQPVERQQQAPAAQPAAQIDLFGGPDPAPARQTSSGPPSAKAAPAPPKATAAKDSLLGLDFLGEPAAPPRPASTPGTAAAAAQSRPDLKQSILSLYASAPKAPVQQQNSFGGMASPTQPATGGFNDAFGGLSISNNNNAPPKPVASDPFASFGNASSMSQPAPQQTSNAFGGLSGGSFFDTKPAQPAAPVHQSKPSNSGFGDFGGFASATPAVQSKPAQPASSAMGDLFDLSAPVSQASPPLAKATSPPSSSVFNLSQPKPSPAPAPTVAAAAVASGADVWGDNAWATPSAPAPAPAPVHKSPEISKPAAAGDFGWGTAGGLSQTPIVPGATGGFSQTPIVPGAGGGFSPAPKVATDEEFGGWSSSTGTTNAASGGQQGGKQGGFGGDDDLFSNVWQ